LVVVNQPLPKWVKPQLARLVEEAPDGKDWLHEVKYDGYRMHARISKGL
jgi:ATP-dependent DNA ligase